MACSSIPNLSFNIKNTLVACAWYDSSPNVDNLQPLHEGESLGNLHSVVVNEQNVIVVPLVRFMETKSNMEATLF